MIKKKNKGFTLVEVLICVGIVGIIAAITIPALLTSTSEKALEAQRKALHSRMAQAFGQINNLKLYEQSNENADGTTYTDTYSALNFITDGLSKVYKLSSTCSADKLRECGIPDSIIDYYNDTDSYTFSLTNKTTLGNDGAAGAASSTAYNERITKDDLGGLNANVAGFKTANGESILLYYNPKCKSKKESQHNLVYSVCVNMIYDINGRNSAPNAYGEDIGYITVFYPTDPTVVMPILNNTKSYPAASFQTMLNTASTEELAPPTLEELVAIMVNKNLTYITKNIDPEEEYWSSSYSQDDITKAWAVSLANGVQAQSIKSGSTDRPYFLIKK